MQTLRAKDVLENINCINSSEFECSQNIVLDFANIESIDLKSITALLNLQKVAILNNKSLSLENLNPNVERTLDVIGINKKITNPILRK